MGVVENIVNLGACWDNASLRRHGESIRALAGENAFCHKRNVKFLGAANALLSDSYRLERACLDREKISRYASRLAKRELGLPLGGVGKEFPCLLSGITPAGNLTLLDSLPALCSRFFVLEDKAGAASHLLLEELRAYALGSGLDVISCTCPLFPGQKLEHLLIPQRGVCFFTQNAFHALPFPAARTIHASRFIQGDAMAESRSRMVFNRKAAAQLLEESVKILTEAKAIHDELEAAYIQAMDFSKVDAITKQLEKELLGSFRSPQDPT